MRGSGTRAGGRPRATITCALLLSALAVLIGHVPARATFHTMSIVEIFAGLGANPDVQYVELRLDAAGQVNVSDTPLAAFNADGSAVTVLVISDRDVSSPLAGASILYATAATETASGITPDFVFAPGIVTPAGMICWGAPGVSTPEPPDSPDDPNSYVDCVAYGDYTGPTRTESGTPSSLPPGDGTSALTRLSGNRDAGDNADDFALAPPDFCNNAGDCGSFRQCGDVDGNGAVDVIDGANLARAAVGLASTCDDLALTICDLNGDEQIDVIDAANGQRAAVGLPNACDG